ncbi:N-acetylmuramoyl-L-alanine amidase family protein [Mangrovicella endophytica]|uniref:N-acetylmuramoyl-L-alanine amidase family protein n=1 Tax=Mangrovicella endophytica TaxID=2066697 RepID=UPI0012FFDA02|nr:N-acetylmuramoyl-L-alanine amidase [Mangrovicella endophytica]
MSDKYSSTAKRLRLIVIMASTAAAIAFGSSTATAGAEEDGAGIITALRQETDGAGFTASIELQGNPDTRLVYLHNPERIALDMMRTVPAVDLPAIKRNKLVTDLRHGLVARDRYRLIFSVAEPVQASTEVSKEGDDTVLTLRLKPGGETVGSIATAPVPASAETKADEIAGDGKLVVVVDPGHGGIDTGAISKDKTLEKNVNLDFALALRDALVKRGGIDVVLTRANDTFIPLAERSAIARRARADLFISMHADSIRYGTLRGATVYTLSERASDALSREIADSENSADRFADPEWRQDQPEVFDILLDLTRRETVSFSEHFATDLVGTLEDHDIGLIKNPKRSAGFRVLKAPDVPSVLLEIGYLSNSDDEKLLLSPEWRGRATEAVAAAIESFLKRRSPVAVNPD